MFCTRWCGVVLLLTAAGWQLATRAQQPPQVFRADANLVYVDVYPRRGDQLVEGLTANDFQISEDGNPQAVQTFEFITFGSSPVDSSRRDPTSVADSERQAADPRNRLFVIYLDRFHTTRAGSRDSRQPLVDFLNRTIGPSDLFAVVTPETPPSGLTFARRTDTIAGELSKHWDWGERDQLLIPRTPAEERLIRCAQLAYAGDAPKVDAIHRRYRENLTHDSLDVLIRRLRDLRDERTNLILVSQGWMPETEREVLAQFPQMGMPPIPTIGVGRGGQLTRGNPQSGNPDAAGCRAELVNLATTNFVERFHDLVTAAERANVTFYPIDVGGLHGDLRTTETLRTLAGATDGYAAVNSNDIAAGFRRVSDRLSSYYLLGYYSTNTANDGRFRKIDVKVSRPGLSVAARRGYLAPPSAAVVAAARADAARTAGPPVSEEVTSAVGQLARLASGQELFAAAAVRAGAIEVVADLAERDVDRGRWSKGAVVEATITDTAGTTVLVQGPIDPGRRATVVRVPISASPNGPWRVHVKATDAQGSVEARVTAEAPSANGLPAPLLLRGAGAARTTMQPVAEPSFRRNERLRVQWPMAATTAQPHAQVLDRRGQPLGTPLSVTETGVGASRVVAFDLTLASLATGDYVLQITGGDAERHLVPFRIVR